MGMDDVANRFDHLLANDIKNSGIVLQRFFCKYIIMNLKQLTYGILNIPFMNITSRKY